MNGTNDFTTLNVDALAKIRHTRESGYPGFGKLLKFLDSRFHGNDVNRAHMQLAAGQLPAAIFNKLSRGTNAHEKIRNYPPNKGESLVVPAQAGIQVFQCVEFPEIPGT
jgi:hypothetical protein